MKGRQVSEQRAKAKAEKLIAATERGIPALPRDKQIMTHALLRGLLLRRAEGELEWKDVYFALNTLKNVPRINDPVSGIVERYLASRVEPTETYLDFWTPKHIALCLVATYISGIATPEFQKQVLKRSGPDGAFFSEGLELFANRFLMGGGHPQFFVMKELAELFMFTNIEVPLNIVRSPFPVLSIRWPEEVDICLGKAASGFELKRIVVVDAGVNIGLCGLTGNNAKQVVGGFPKDSGVTGEQYLNIPELKFAEVYRFALNVLLYTTNRQEDVVGDRAGIIEKLKAKLAEARNGKTSRGLRKRITKHQSRMIYVMGKKFRRPPGSPAVSLVMMSRHVVRGHWRNQPYGPGRQFLKLIWIKPHIRGGSPREKRPRAKDYAVTIFPEQGVRS